MPHDQRLRVCFLLSNYPPAFAGHGIQIQRSLPYLAARGVDATVLTWAVPGRDQRLPADPVGRVDRLLASEPGRIGDLRRVFQMRRYFERRRGAFDLVHSSVVGWEFLLNVGRMRRMGMPVLVEMVLLGSDDPVSISRERFGSFKMSRLRDVDYWIGISGPFRSQVLAAGIPDCRYSLVPTGVDVNGYRPLSAEERRAVRLRLGLSPEARILVSVGAVMHRKGVDRLLQVWERLGPVPGRDLLVVVGPITAEESLSPADLAYARPLLEKSRGPALDGTVRWTGMVGNVQDYLGAADLFLFLSRKEGLGTVILEASACGIPCVVSPLDGIAAEIIDPGRTGVIVGDPDDAAAVATTIAGLLDDAAARTAMGSAARRTIVERFSLEARADALSAIYRGLVGSGDRPLATSTAPFPRVAG
jgi:glycosyltransferase involved in cell wall biosynthesis